MTQHQMVAVTGNVTGCSVCRGVGDGLPVECPGYAMSLVAQHAVARGHAQFVSGKWFLALDQLFSVNGRELAVVLNSPFVRET